jgi:type II secretory pathway pseudopilin PulG
MRRQQGFVLILSLLLVLVVGTSFLLADPSNVASRYGQRAADQARTMAEARAGLLAYALAGGKNSRPGALPCPDGDGDGVTDVYCQSGGESVYLKRFPWRTLDIGSQSSGLWYAVDRDVRDNPDVEPLNPNVEGSLSINGQDGFVAVLIDPGDALKGQDRSTGNVDAFLEAGNHAGDTEFFDCSDDPSCNDRVRGITVDELFGGVQQRVLAGAERMLRDFYGSNGHFPRPAQFGSEECDGTMTPPLVGQLPFTDNVEPYCDGVLDKTDDPTKGQWMRVNEWFPFIVYRVESDCAGQDATCATATLKLGGRESLQVVLAAAGKELEGPRHDTSYTQNRSGTPGIRDYLDGEENVTGHTVFDHGPITQAHNDELRGFAVGE